MPVRHLGLAVILLGCTGCDPNSKFDPAAQALGIAGFFLASISLGWQIYTYRANRTQRIRASARYEQWSKDQAYFAIDIYNSGAIPAYIKSVTIEWNRTQEYQPDGSIRLETDPFQHKVLDGAGTICYQATRTWSRKEPLAPHASCTFYIFDTDRELIHKMRSTVPAKRAWISIRSNGGELLRIKGKKFMTQLFVAGSLWEDFENAAKARIAAGKV